MIDEVFQLSSTKVKFLFSEGRNGTRLKLFQNKFLQIKNHPFNACDGFTRYIQDRERKATGAIFNKEMIIVLLLCTFPPTYIWIPINYIRIL